MIDWEKTAELNNMDIKEIQIYFNKYPQSNKFIITICTECGKIQKTKKQAYRDLCVSCAGRKRKYNHGGDADIWLARTECEKLTFEEFGYKPSELSSQSNKHIIAICIECKTIRETTKNGYHDLCQSCAQRKRYPQGENISFWLENKECEDLTFEKFGYRPSDLSSHSSMLIVAVCTECGKTRLTSKDSYRELCSICARKDIIKRRKSSATQQNILYEDWENFATDSPYCPDFNEECKESNREKYNRRCFLTGLLELKNVDKNGKQIRLSVHHVDMDKGQGCDGKRWKLVPLSMKCHGKVHNELWESRIIWLLDNIWN